MQKLTHEERQVAETRMRLLLAAHGSSIDALSRETGIARGTMMHVVGVVLEAEPATDCARVILAHWHDWSKALGQGGDYENFAVYIRRRIAK